jgi:hypothetical protein
MLDKRQHYVDRLTYWSDKIASQAAESFVPVAGVWAIHLLQELDRRPDRSAEAKDLPRLAETVGIPRKFFSRALALTNGLVSLHLGPPTRIVLHRKRLLQSKVAVEKERGRISVAHRARLFEADGHQCVTAAKSSLPPTW